METMPFPFNLILVPDWRPGCDLAQDIAVQGGNQRLTAEDCGGKRNADGRLNIHLLALPPRFRGDGDI